MTTTTPAPPAVRALADRLALATGVHVIVTVDPDQDHNACAYTDPCTGAARIDIGATDGDDAMAGTLAHEFAHHQLGHVGRRRVWFTVHQWAAYSLVGSILAAIYVPMLTWLTTRAIAVEFAVFVLSMLIGTARERADEYAADALAVQLLNGRGIDGQAATIASLRKPIDPWWHRVTWIADTHPTTAARIRRIRAISRNENARPVLSHRTGL